MDQLGLHSNRNSTYIVASLTATVRLLSIAVVALFLQRSASVYKQKHSGW